uniref:Uncharacterized protein n=1 Tax=Tanacetum cinerariifolium TaxID=118510 RepID=A0A699HTH4_TANCI|nr:hypothetical protein [Tanacetum cinerariifolium]
METEDISERYDASCFVNGLEAYDGEINLGHDKNLISNEYAVKLRLEHEVKNGDKVVKKELIVALRGEIYLVTFIINLEEDDIKPGVVLGRSFLRLTKGIADFKNRIITIYPNLDPFNDVDSVKANDSEDNWDVILEGIDFGDIPEIDGLKLPPYVCNMGKSFIDQHNKLLDSVMLDKLKLVGEVEANEEESIKEVIKGYKTLREKEDPCVFVLPIRLEAKIDSFALADICSNINGLLNIMGFAEEIEEMLEIKVYEIGGKQEIFTSKAYRRLLGLYHADEVNDEGFKVYFQGGLRSNENFNARDFWLSISSEEELHLSRSLGLTIRHPILRVLQNMITYGVCQRTTGYDKMQRNELWLMSMFEAKHQNGYVNVIWLMEKWLKRKGVESQMDSMIFCGQALDAITFRELIDPDERLIAEDPSPKGEKEREKKWKDARKLYTQPHTILLNSS